MSLRLGPLKLKLQLVCGDGFALGPGKADVLEAIAAHGSISAAGRALGMSYRRTWLLVDEMNRCFAERLVETTPGARLTEAGRTALAAYRALEARSATIADTADYQKLAAMLREQPLPSKRD